MKTKNQKESANKFQEWLQSLNTKPKVLRTDKGKEFDARMVKAVLLRYNVEWQGAAGTSKASVAERANKTIQILLYKYMTKYNTTRYIDILDDIVNTYNTRPHRTL
jgi:hypothetical protein